jgi:hypothetical protein
VALCGDAPTSKVIEAGSASGLADVANADTDNATPALIADGVPTGVERKQDELLALMQQRTF